MPSPVYGVILAAGQSRRMGQPKQLLPFGGATLIEHAARMMAASPVDRTIVVLRPGLGDVGHRLTRQGAHVITVATDTPLASLQAALRACPEAAAIVLCPADQPAITPGIVGRLLSGWHRSGLPAAISTYEGERGHPLLLSGPALAAVPTLHGERAVWRLLTERPEWVVEIEMGLPLPPDLNNPADYEAVLRRGGI